MKLGILGANRTVVITNDYKQVFFSYNTPVAAIIDGVSYKTDRRWSRTTSKHITQFLFGAKSAIEMPQEWFDNLLEVK